MTASKDVKFKGLFAVCHGKSGSRRCDLGVNPQQIINTIASTEERKAAQQKAIDAIIDIPGVERISAGNFEGQLGEHKTNLLDILKE